jgi:hypothetical protein
MKRSKKNFVLKNLFHMFFRVLKNNAYTVNTLETGATIVTSCYIVEL